MPPGELDLEVLLVEDNPGDARLVEHHLNAPHVADIAGDVNLQHETSLTDALELLDSQSPDILFLDLGLPESTGLATLERVLEADLRLPIVVLTGLDDRESAVTAIQRGAQDYLFKDDLDADMLARALRYAIERYRQEEQLRRQNERLDKFASVVSHDLRNPLNVAQSRVELAMEDDSEHLDAAAQALERMEQLIDDLLTLARQGKAVDELEPVALGDLVSQCWQTVDTKAAELVVDSDKTILADRSRLQQLLENLLRNAIEHGGENVTVTIGDFDDGFYVEDDGAGIPETVRERVFEMGYSRSADGTGFGLMIVNVVAEAHDWSISVVEGEAGGARFEISGVSTATGPRGPTWA